MTTKIIGHRFKVDFGEYVFQLDFHSDRSLTWTALSEDGSLADSTMTVEITRTEVRPDVWLVSWEEPPLDATVVHLQDFANREVWTHITMMGEKNFLRMHRPLTRIA